MNRHQRRKVREAEKLAYMASYPSLQISGRLPHLHQTRPVRLLSSNGIDGHSQLQSLRLNGPARRLPRPELTRRLGEWFTGEQVCSHEFDCCGCAHWWAERVEFRKGQRYAYVTQQVRFNY